MIQKVKLMSQNPLSAQAMKVSKSKKSEKDLETRILENSIGKFCDLLSIGFGEAGSEIISNNIRSGGDLNPMLPGKKVRAIFGFCDIRNFTDITEVLQEDVMEFVNYIASIVHAEVSLHGGAANKNIGDAFLVVWKLPTSDNTSKSFPRSRGSIIEAKSAVAPDDPAQSTEQLSQHIADAALASMMIIHASLKRSKMLADISQRRDIQDRLPDFTVSMGFGLHVGWAIEGAIGSRYKIDPSYLSPHVNMAARLEAATKQYKVPILLSDSFVSLLSPPVRRKCRAIDTVRVKGSMVPTTIYTYDIDTSTITTQSNAQEDDSGKDDDFTKHETFSDYPYFDEYEEHPDLAAASCKHTETFFSDFSKAYDAYIRGDWNMSMEILQDIQACERKDGTQYHDGPCSALLSFMRSMNGHPPPSWPGCRDLSEK
jgi:class 3 adenylate cyclase